MTEDITSGTIGFDGRVAIVTGAGEDSDDRMPSSWHDGAHWWW
jgi:hypothetical protein